MGQSERRIAALEGLVWITQDPEGLSRIAEASRPGILSVEEGMRAMLLRMTTTRRTSS